MILVTGNPEVFFDTLCRHLAPNKAWSQAHTHIGRAIEFGDFWSAISIVDEDEESNTAPISAVRLRCDGFDEEDIDIIEGGICTLEGFEFYPGSVLPTGDDDDDESPIDD